MVFSYFVPSEGVIPDFLTKKAKQKDNRLAYATEFSPGYGLNSKGNLSCAFWKDLLAHREPGVNTFFEMCCDAINFVIHHQNIRSSSPPLVRPTGHAHRVCKINVQMGHFIRTFLFCSLHHRKDSRPAFVQGTHPYQSVVFQDKSFTFDGIRHKLCCP